MQTRPFVFVNMAMTADGKIDTVSRHGARISGPADTARVDRLRAEADAIMVGARTLLAEDPRLTVRDDSLIARRRQVGKAPQPAKTAVVSRITPGLIPPEGDFVREGGARVIVCTTERTPAEARDELRAAGVETLVAGDDRVDLVAALSGLAALGIERLMVEGGSTLVAGLLEARLVDELYLAVAPLLFGGATAPTPVGGIGWSRESALGLELIDTSTDVDDDVVLRYRLTDTAVL